MSAHLHADGACRDILSVPGSLNAGAITGSPYVHMDGQAVFKLAVNVMTQVGNEALAANRVDVGAVPLVERRPAAAVRMRD